MSTRTYYILCALQDSDEWFMEFGDYDKQVVQDEKLDSFFMVKTKIIACNDSQDSIDLAVLKLNK